MDRAKQIGGMNMGIIDLIFLPAAVVSAIFGVLANAKKSEVCAVLSFMFCTMPPIGSIFDINVRAAKGDLAGIQDIYPVMGIVYLVVFIIVILINVARVIKNS
ncbi:MAG: hypothetical protein NC124_01120 [Clostridium sp.]|nr:hypothetical protein [Clostridium sp.]